MGGEAGCGSSDNELGGDGDEGGRSWEPGGEEGAEDDEVGGEEDEEDDVEEDEEEVGGDGCCGWYAERCFLAGGDWECSSCSCSCWSSIESKCESSCCSVKSWGRGCILLWLIPGGV